MWRLLGAFMLGVAILGDGFLLTRVEIAERASVAVVPRCFDTIVVVLIDALRFDFASPDAPIDAKSKAYHGHLPVIGEALSRVPDQARLFRFVADGPTTTMQRLKGLTTGSLPTFIDAGSNFASDAITEDSWVTQAKGRGVHLTVLGDDTWGALFPGQFDVATLFPSFDVADLDTNDAGVDQHLGPAVAAANRRAAAGNASIVLAHFLGVDHIGHSFSQGHPAMKRKLGQMNRIIHRLMGQVSNRSLLLVMGDHGMTAGGDHGGATEDETSAALFAYAPSGLGVPRQRASAGHTVWQTDLVPTISLALGLPIPFASIGAAIPELLLAHATASAGLEIAFVNMQQVWHYLQVYEREARQLPQDEMAVLRGQFNAAEAARQAGQNRAALQHSNQFLHSAARMLRNTFATFDMPEIWLGLAVIVISLMALVSEVALDASERTAPTSRLSWPTAMLATVIASWMYALDRHLDPAMWAGLIAMLECAHDLRAQSGGGLPGVVAARRAAEAISVETAAAVAFVGIHASMVLSNSYIEAEQGVVDFFLCSAGTLLFRKALESSNTTATRCSLAFMLLVRVAPMAQIAAQGKHTNATPPVSEFILRSLLPCAGLCLIARQYMRTTQHQDKAMARWSASMLLIAAFAAIGAVAALDFWWIRTFRSVGWKADIGEVDCTHGLFGTLLKLLAVEHSVEKDALSARLLLPRIVYCCSLTGMTLCIVQGAMRRLSPHERLQLHGLGLLCLALLLCTLLGPFSPLLVFMMSAQCALLVKMGSSLGAESAQLLRLMCWVLSGRQYFFLTGHAFTFSSLHMSAAFVGFEHTSTLRSGLMIVANTFAPYILAMAAFPAFSAPGKERSRAVWAALLMQAAATAFACLCVAVHRRHLFVWAVFAPKYVYEMLIMLLLSVGSSVAGWQL